MRFYIRALIQAIGSVYFAYRFISDTTAHSRLADGICVAISVFLTYDFCTRVRKNEKSKAMYRAQAEEYFGETAEEFHNREQRRHPEGLHNQKFARRNSPSYRAKGYSRTHQG